MLKRLSLGLLVLFFTGSMMATEEPKYTLIEKSGAFELRTYHSKVIAETWVSGSLDEASRAGFKILANYIFGNNTSKTGAGEKITMTSPVTIKPISEKITMTSPVSMEQTGEQWRMYFVMPNQYTLKTLPTPNNPAVALYQVPLSHYAVVRFSGLVSDNDIATKTAELVAWLDNKKITPIGKAELARYNPPWTLPFLRRNEIMIEY